MDAKQQNEILQQIWQPRPYKPIPDWARERCKVDPEFKAKMRRAALARLDTQQALADAQIKGFVTLLRREKRRKAVASTVVALLCIAGLAALVMAQLS